MENLKRYNYLNEYLKEKFGERTLKICIDGGFTCPNRDGTKGENGCVFCSEKGSGEHIKNVNFSDNSQHLSIIEKQILSIQNQVKKHLTSYKGERANKFIAYFQNFTNTYDTVENLKKKYDAALIDNKIVALAVATRPDCIDEEKVKLLKSYADKYYVWVDIGFQTSNEETANLINRCYSNKEFTRAIELLNKYNIDVVTHVMVGLPNETHEDLKNTIEFLNKHNIQGIKIHSTYVVENTKLAELYINKNIIIHRFSGDAPKENLLAPEWNTHKKWVLNGINKIMKEQNLFQGMYN